MKNSIDMQEIKNSSVIKKLNLSRYLIIKNNKLIIITRIIYIEFLNKLNLLLLYSIIFLKKFENLLFKSTKYINTPDSNVAIAFIRLVCVRYFIPKFSKGEITSITSKSPINISTK